MPGGRQRRARVEVVVAPMRAAPRQALWPHGSRCPEARRPEAVVAAPRQSLQPYRAPQGRRCSPTAVAAAWRRAARCFLHRMHELTEEGTIEVAARRNSVVLGRTLLLVQRSAEERPCRWLMRLSGRLPRSVRASPATGKPLPSLRANTSRPQDGATKGRTGRRHGKAPPTPGDTRDRRHEAAGKRPAPHCGTCL